MGFPKGKGFSTKDVKRFDWKLYPKAEKFLQRQVHKFLAHNPKARSLAKKMREQTSTRIFDWIDHITLPSTSEQKLKSLDFSLVRREANTKVYQITQSILFPVLISE